MAYDLTAELFSELAIGMVIFGVRFYARWKIGGFRGFGLDDLFAGVAIIFWVFEATFLYTTGAIGSNVGLTEQTALEVPDSDVPRLTKGSQHAYVAWIFYILLIWTLKGVLLLLFHRLTMGTWQSRLARVMMFVSIATFMASLFWHIFSCFPTHKAWQIKPYPGDDCTIRRGNYIIITILDVVTDLGIMIIPLPMLVQTTLSVRRKLSLGVLFSSGIFVMICAIIRAYYSLANIETLTVALGWASREILVAAIVVCAPSIKPLVTAARKKMTSGHTSASWKSQGPSRYGGHSRISNNNDDPEDNVATAAATSDQHLSPHYPMSPMTRTKMELPGKRLSGPRSESQDHINAMPDTPDSGSTRDSVGKDGIVVTTEIQVSSR